MVHNSPKKHQELKPSAQSNEPMGDFSHSHSVLLLCWIYLSRPSLIRTPCYNVIPTFLCLYHDVINPNVCSSLIFFPEWSSVFSCSHVSRILHGGRAMEHSLLWIHLLWNMFLSYVGASIFVSLCVYMCVWELAHAPVCFTCICGLAHALSEHVKYWCS